MVKRDGEGRPSEALAQQIGHEVERALEAQVPAVRIALKQALAESGATLRWEPDAQHPRRVTVLIGGNELVEIDLVRPLVQ